MRRTVRDALCPRSGPALRKGRVSGDFSHTSCEIVPCFRRHQIRSTHGCERSRHGPGAYLQRNAVTRRYPVAGISHRCALGLQDVLGGIDADPEDPDGPGP